MNMEPQRGDKQFEALSRELNDAQLLSAYKKPLDSYQVSFVPRFLGKLLVFCGNMVYGRDPSYLKFRAVEVIARVPYHSWSSAAYTMMTLFYTDEQKARELSEVAQFARLSQDNETMHVVVISHIAEREGERAGFIRHTLIPMCFAFFYFWTSQILYFVNSRYSYELNYMFESHAFEQYDQFLRDCGEELRNRAVCCDFLVWYGRYPRSQYEFFMSVRNDELIHRNMSIRKIEEPE